MNHLSNQNFRTQLLRFMVVLSHGQRIRQISCVFEIFSFLSYRPLLLQYGLTYDKKPFKVNVKKYHLYKWCGCGRSHSQPFCDTTCQNKYWKRNIVGGPVTYIAPEDKEVWFCQCKRTKHRPFCDGTHRSEEIAKMKFADKIELFEPFVKAK